MSDRPEPPPPDDLLEIRRHDRKDPLPPEPLEYRQRAESHRANGAVLDTIACALLAIAGELAAARREAKRGR